MSRSTERPSGTCDHRGVPSHLTIGAGDIEALRLGVAVLAVGVGLASGLGPFALATLSDTVGVQLAFLVIPLLAVGAAAGVLASSRRS